MEENIKKLISEDQQLRERICKIDKAIDSFKEVFTPSETKKLTDKLKKETKQIIARLKKIRTATKALQEACTHVGEQNEDLLKYVGHDSHKDYYTCTNCNWETSV